MELAHVELQPNDGEHEDGEEEQQPNLQQGDHGLHDGLEHHLQTWARAGSTVCQRVGWGVGGTARAWAGRAQRHLLKGQRTQLGVLLVRTKQGLGKGDQW